QLIASVYVRDGEQCPTERRRFRCSSGDEEGAPAPATLAQRVQRPGTDSGGAVGRGWRTGERAWSQPRLAGPAPGVQSAQAGGGRPTEGQEASCAHVCGTDHAAQISGTRVRNRSRGKTRQAAHRVAGNGNG